MLILAWATQVTEVEFELPGYGENDSVHNSNRMMQFIDWEAHNISTRGNRDLPLAKVQHLKVGIFSSRHDTELPMSVFHLPRLRILETSGFRIDSRDNVPIPEHGFAIETLYLNDSEIIGTGAWGIIGACRELLALSVSLNDMVPAIASERAISNALLRQAGSLKKLHLNFNTWRVIWLDESPLDELQLDENQLVSSHEEVPLCRCFDHLSKLEILTVDVEDLRSSPEEQIMPDFFGSALPLSLKKLTINWKTGVENYPEEIFLQRGEHDVYLDVVESLMGLLVEAGAGHRNALRYIYASEVLRGSSKLYEVEKIAEENGVLVYVEPLSDDDDDYGLSYTDYLDLRGENWA